eukprot:scaffold256547_cov25-Prasinocladus_malaysianus.AAC.1
MTALLAIGLGLSAPTYLLRGCCERTGEEIEPALGSASRRVVKSHLFHGLDALKRKKNEKRSAVKQKRGVGASGVRNNEREETERNKIGSELQWM